MAQIDVAGFIHDDDRLRSDRFEDRVDKRENFDALVEANLEDYQDNNDEYLINDAAEESLFEVKPQNYRNDRSSKDLGPIDKEIPKYHSEFLTQSKYKNLHKKCSKKQKIKSQKSTTFLKSTTQMTTDTTQYKLNKRSYLERICPICRRKFIGRRSHERDDVIHNSRQYYDKKDNMNYVDNFIRPVSKDTDTKNSKEMIPSHRIDSNMRK
ncbi:unnamed protein product [Leptosia nina]|uniref:C2H2-type domain-containing protein n=1 Tax=Leptosia nina TaxID=320188 RepID=A0AAV1J177_9NEOP